MRKGDNSIRLCGLNLGETIYNKDIQCFWKRTTFLLSVLFTDNKKEVNIVNGTQKSGMLVFIGEWPNSPWFIWLDTGLREASEHI